MSNWAFGFWIQVDQLFKEYLSFNLTKLQLNAIAAKALFPKAFLLDLLDTYCDVPDSVILYFVVSNPKDPEKAIDKFIRLNPKF